MNKKAQLDFFEDTNWVGFGICLLIGYGVIAFQFIIWKGMDFHVPLWQKIVIMLLIPVAAFVMSKIFFRD